MESFYRVPSKVLAVEMRNKGISVVLIRSVISVYEGAVTRFRLDFVLLEKFVVKVWLHQESVFSPFFLKLW